MPRDKGLTPAQQDTRLSGDGTNIPVDTLTDVQRLDIRNGEDRFLFLYKTMLRRWQLHLLHKQLKMLHYVCDLFIQYFITFCPMLTRSIESWRTSFKNCFSEEIMAEKNTCFRPLSYHDITLQICDRLSTHTRIRSQDVFTVFKYRYNATYSAEFILKLCLPHDSAFEIFGHSKITFFAYDYFNKYPFSKFAAVFNGKIYDVKGSVVGPLTLATLNSLRSEKCQRFYACSVTQLRYLLTHDDSESEESNNDIVDDTSEAQRDKEWEGVYPKEFDNGDVWK
jgi:hypothetical protein